MRDGRLDPLGDSILAERERQVARFLMEQQVRAAHQQRGIDSMARRIRVGLRFRHRVARYLGIVIGHSDRAGSTEPVTEGGDFGLGDSVPAISSAEAGGYAPASALEEGVVR
jgi:hypothetical protein